MTLRVLNHNEGGGIALLIDGAGYAALTRQAANHRQSLASFIAGKLGVSLDPSQLSASGSDGEVDALARRIAGV